MLRASRNIVHTLKCHKHGSRVGEAGQKMSTQPQPPSMKTPVTPSVSPKAPSNLPTPEKKGGLLKLLGVTLLGVGVGSGGVVGYAWYNEDFKQQMEDKVPYAKELFDILFPYLPNTSSFKMPELPSVGIVSNPDSVKDQGLWKRRDTPAEPAVESKVTASVTSSVPVEPATTQVSTSTTKHVERATPEAEPLKVEVKISRDKEEQERLTRRRLETEAVEKATANAALETMLSAALTEAESSCHEATELQSLATHATTKYADDLKRAMDDNSGAETSGQWTAANESCEAWKTAEKQANVLATSARESLEKLRYLIEDGRQETNTKQNKVLIDAQEKLNKLTYNLETEVSKYTKATSDVNVMKQYREIAEKGKEQFKKELESILPDVTLGGARGKSLSEDELNSLIAHAHRRVEQLQKQIAEQQAGEEHRLQMAIEQQMEQNESASRALVKMEVERKRSDWELEQQKREYENQIAFERELRRELALQAAAHSEHIQDVLRVQQRDLTAKYDEDLRASLIDERNNFINEVGDSLARLQGIEAAVEARAETEKRGRKAQELWLSCQSLLEAITDGRKDADTWEEQVLPLGGVLAAIQQAGDDHPFVKLLLNSVPELAVQRGVWTEDALKERFYKVRRVCKRVGMLDDESGGTLFKYFLSYIQSFLVFNSVVYTNPEDSVDLSEMDSYELLTHAAYYVRNGDLESATRFMNQLRGEPRQVASDWIREARLLLETRQVALALNAHASACGLGTLF